MARVCVVSNCNSCYNGTPSTLFKYPLDKIRAEKWDESILPYADPRKMKRKVRHICDLHFTDDCFVKNVEKVLIDGKEKILPRQRKRITADSVPSLFSEVNKIPENLAVQNDIFGENNESTDSEKLLNAKNTRITSSTFPNIHLSAFDEERHPLPLNLDYGFPQLCANLDKTKPNLLPTNWSHNVLPTGMAFVYFGDTLLHISRSVLVKKDMSIEVRGEGRLCPNSEKYQLTRFEDVLEILRTVSSSHICIGIGGTPCPSVFFGSEQTPKSLRCSDCRKNLKRQRDKEQKAEARNSVSKEQTKKLLRNFKRQLSRREDKLKNYKKQVLESQEIAATAKKEAIEEAISILPKTQQEAVKACFHAAQTTDKRGLRYTTRWILQCLLLRIKSRKAYLHMRNHQIGAFPTISTLNRYLCNLKPSFGFQEELFEIFKLKGSTMKPWEKRGTLVLDEIQLSEGIHFDSKTLLTMGFVDLGEHTAEDQRHVKGDHALVFLFQPFRGQWVQSVGAFLSKSCANSTVLHQLILECIILIEKAGFKVDVVTSDGAAWNRKMWQLFGLRDSDTSCEHPCSSLFEENYEKEDSDSTTRRLWFASDFSHLIKNLRNFLVKLKKILTPDGLVRIQHLSDLIEIEGGKQNYGLKIAHKLTLDHLNPKNYQKMNVGMAFELFSPNTIVALETYAFMENKLEECTPTIKFFSKVGKLIEAMSSRTSKNSLSPNNESYKVIENFLEYIQDWKFGVEEVAGGYMTSNTHQGIIVTLKTALEVSTFLVKKCDFNYLMTARMNQDCLESFFGMIRSCCGSTDKPDPLLFIEIYRLLTFYSLVKPPKGSNVEGVELFENLLTPSDMKIKNDSKDQYEKTLDSIIQKGENAPEEYGPRHAHDYNVHTPNDFAQSYVAGFLVYRIGKWTTCEECIQTVSKESGDLPRDSMIDGLNRGKLKYPSDKLFQLLIAVERGILQTVGEEPMHCYTFLRVGQNVLAESLVFVGCDKHKDFLTRSVINYYILARARMICKKYNRANDELRQKERMLRKNVKLVKQIRKEEKQK